MMLDRTNSPRPRCLIAEDQGIPETQGEARVALTTALESAEVQPVGPWLTVWRTPQDGLIDYAPGVFVPEGTRELALAGAVVALGGAIWSLWKSSRSGAYRGFEVERRGSAFRGSSGVTNTDTTSTRLADTNPPGSLGPTATRRQEAAEAGAMPIS